eukprot:1562837-Prymnesium_polylepis.1
MDHIAGDTCACCSLQQQPASCPASGVRMSPLLARKHCLHDCTSAGHGSHVCAPWRDALVLFTVAVPHGR